MGVTLKMFVRRLGRPMPDAELRRLAARMCSAFGSNRFFTDPCGRIGDGQEYLETPRHHHALSIAPTVRARREATLADAAGRSLHPWEEEELAALAGLPPDAPTLSQDGPLIVGTSFEHFIYVHAAALYYGVGYERGDWLFIRALAEFLERNLPDGKVWYGGDGSSVVARPLDLAARRKLDEHFQAQQASYPMMGQRSARLCAFCGGWPMMDLSVGGEVHYLSCDGCGRREAHILATGEYLDIPAELEWPVQLDLETREFLVLRPVEVVEDGEIVVRRRFQRPEG